MNHKIVRFMKTSVVLAGMMGFFLLSSGCAMRGTHYKSLLDLREETARNYSQQVIDAIVGVRDKSTLPLFFSVEAGVSSWSPSLSGGLSAQIPGPWRARTTALIPSLQGSESMSNQIQFNDFGAAPMSRVNSLYALLCFHYSIGSVELPNGTLYTIVNESPTAEGLQFTRRLKNGNYLGVPHEKNEDFLKFCKDITFWTRHSAPDPKDLNSAAGMIYRFSIEYPTSIITLANALKTRDSSKAALGEAQKSLVTEKQAYDQLVNESKTSKTAPEIMTTLLGYKREEVKGKLQSLGAVSAAIQQAESDISSQTANLQSLVQSLQKTLEKVKTNDPDASQIDVQGAVNGLMGQISQLLQGNKEVMEQLQATSIQGTDLKAEDSVDKLYRDRFESLPQRFEGALQAQP